MCYKSFAKTAFAGSWKVFKKTLHKKWFSHQKGTYPAFTYSKYTIKILEQGEIYALIQQ